ncbi:MAG: hypothetical protein IPP44_00415 [Ideonella sp.]|nr:hypothetical protein [Ideonella sp.]
MEPNIKDIRDATLRRIGRNVFNFQRLETFLKSLIPAMSCSGTPSNFSDRHKARVKKLSKKGLGKLADNFHSDVYGKPSAATGPSDLLEPSITFSMGIETDPNNARVRKQKLLGLVRERNRLIHFDLAGVDLNSLADCNRLSAHLDEQNDRIRLQLEELEALRTAHSLMIAELLSYFESGEFLAMLQQGSNDA